MDSTLFSTALNAAQLEAVAYNDGPLLVIAGAGSGKTRVLTYKIAYLLQMGYEPWSILALTFTNKAAREMNERISGICGNEPLAGLWSGTFHSIFARLLRRECNYINYPTDFTIYDTADSRSLIKTIVREFGLDDKIYKPTTISARISEAKNLLILPPEYSADSSIKRRDDSEGLGEMGRIYDTYQQRLRAGNAMDFDDLLLNTYLLLSTNQEVCERYKRRFRYILVDEYQDTNMAQYRILRLLTDSDSCICVVGDDAQSIYSFRGADIRNILNFTKDYPSAKVVKLECNYRSTQCIVDAANCIISQNKSQIPKRIYAANEGGERIKVFKAQTDKEEAQKVVKYIIKLVRKGVEYDNIALLYRTNAQSRSFEEALQHSKIPYRIYGGLSFYQRKEVKDVLAYLRLIVNVHDEEAFRRVINYPKRDIGSTSVLKIQNAAAAAGVSMWAAIADPVSYNLDLRGKAAKQTAAFVELITAFQKYAANHTASDVVKHVVKFSGIARDIVREITAENIARQENIDELIGSVLSYEKERFEEDQIARVTLSEFLATVSLLSDTDQSDDSEPRVTLMTVHAAKGLEFDAVFVTGMEEDLFPSAMARGNRKELEEERRLFYVAVTRARRFCFLSYADSRFRYGSLQFADVSSFISDIDEEYLDYEHTATARSPRTFSNRSADSRWGSASYRSADTYGGTYTNDWGGSERSRNFDSFFGTPSEDEFRSSFGASTRSEYDNEGSGYSRCRSYNKPEPRRVVPPAPPVGFKRAGITPKTSNTESKDAPASVAGLSIGTRIVHDRFGEGTVVGMEGKGDSAKIRVDFGMPVGAKNLLVKFAKFKLL